MPAIQLDPEPQTKAEPQPPQLALSLIVLTHAFAQSVGNARLLQVLAQTGTTPLQVAEPFVGGTQGVHMVPHELTAVSLTHAPLQSCIPTGQTQTEFLQLLPPVQACEAAAVLQAPQLFVSVCVLTSQPFDAIPSQFP
jgi:hypothetical protein